MRKTGFRLGGGRAGRRGWRSAAGAAATLAVAVVPSGAVAAPAFEVEQLAEQRGISVNEAERRLDAQARMPELESTMRDSLGTSFGGIWVDTDDGDTITVGVASADAGARAQARAEAAAFDIDVDFRTVRYTARELDDAATWLSQRLGKADAGAKYPLGAGIRTDLNVVEIQAPAGRDLTAAQQDVVDEAEARFGDLIRLGEYTGAPALRACVYAFCDPPLRGGIRLLRPNQDAVCTGGFVSRGRGSNNYLFLMTAGHCATAGTWYTRIPGNALRTLGPWHNGVNNSSGDAGIIRVLDNGYWNARSWVWVTASGDTTSNHQYRIRSDAGSWVGLWVCTTGAFYGQSDCGTVTQVGVTFLGRGNHARGTFCGTGGDSGAPMYAGHTAYGLQTGGYSACDSVYMLIHPAENLLNVNVTHAND